MVFRSIYSAIATGKNGEHLYATAEDGHAEVAVCEAIIKSHQAKKWVKA
jgi:predicted dehydrogenase